MPALTSKGQVTNSSVTHQSTEERSSPNKWNEKITALESKINEQINLGDHTTRKFMDEVEHRLEEKVEKLLEEKLLDTSV